MSVWVVVGGQYGSEGKGKIAAFITVSEQVDICVRCGGPNSGHCFVEENGQLRVLRQIPTGFIRPRTRLLIPSGGLIDLGILRMELEFLGLGTDRVGIDPRAMVIEPKDCETEVRLGLRDRLSSTLCGVGSAVARRVLRGSDVSLAEDAANEATWLKPYLVDAAVEVNSGIDLGKRVLVEGTQGFGLSLYHSSAYPKTTSRDTSAAGCLSECGISPLAVTNVVLVLRTFPIRVAGQQAGPMYQEVDWATITRESGCPHPVAEYTTVSGKLRRVGRFDYDLSQKAVTVNRPTSIALNFLDYISYENRLARSISSLTEQARLFLGEVERELATPVLYAGVGPALDQTFPIPGNSDLSTARPIGIGASDERRRDQAKVV